MLMSVFCIIWIYLNRPKSVSVRVVFGTISLLFQIMAAGPHVRSITTAGIITSETPKLLMQ